MSFSHGRIGWRLVKLRDNGDGGRRCHHAPLAFSVSGRQKIARQRPLYWFMELGRDRQRRRLGAPTVASRRWRLAKIINGSRLSLGKAAPSFSLFSGGFGGNERSRTATEQADGPLPSVVFPHRASEVLDVAESFDGFSSSPPCVFNKPLFQWSPQALGGHTNVHWRDKARLTESSPSNGQRGVQNGNNPTVPVDARGNGRTIETNLLSGFLPNPSIEILPNPIEDLDLELRLGPPKVE
nr:probable transcriptional regulator RABBIT EARS [Ipomoea batatas]